MGIWQTSDFKDAFIWALLSIACHLFTQWAKKATENDPSLTEFWKKFVSYMLIVLRGLTILTAIFSIGTIALPLLDALLTGLLGKAFDIFDKYGGLAIIATTVVFLWKNKHPRSAPADDGEDTPVDVEYAEQEAAELHEEVCELTYEAAADTSENTPLKRSQGSAGIETGREKPYTMDGTMAIHQFSVDTDTPLDKAGEDLVLRELQRHMNQRGKRYPHLCREGRAPIIFDLKNNGNFVIIEVVLYSEKYKGKIEARRKARIARQQQTGDTYDRDF